MKNLFMIRGLPGSGKSTYAHNLSSAINNCCVFEADDFFISANGRYSFDSKLLQFAHQQCLANVAHSLYHNGSAIVANTFVTSWEMKKYFDLKLSFPDLKVHVYEIKTQFDNIHNVPPEKIAKMLAKWEEVDQSLIDSGVVAGVLTIK